MLNSHNLVINRICEKMDRSGEVKGNQLLWLVKQGATNRTRKSKRTHLGWVPFWACCLRCPIHVQVDKSRLNLQREFGTPKIDMDLDGGPPTIGGGWIRDTGEGYPRTVRRGMMKFASSKFSRWKSGATIEQGHYGLKLFGSRSGRPSYMLPAQGLRKLA